MADSAPLDTPYSLNPTPEVLDDLIVEIVDSENTPGSYIRLSPGTPHPDQEQYPGYLFLKQTTLSHNKVQRFWSTPAFRNQNVRNWEKEYVAESTAHPIFIRTYKTRRDQYDAAAALSTLSGVWLVKLTNAGTGYNPDLPPAVTFGGPGTGATATALVNPDGTLSWIRITAEGSGYTSAPTVTIAPPTSGTTATATATVQASSCVLVSQKTQNFPEDDPRFSLFLIEIRAYKTLPGPLLPSRGFRPDGTIQLHTERDVVVTTQPSDAADITSCVVQALDSIQGREIIDRLVAADGETPITNDVGYILYHTEPRTHALLGTILRQRPKTEALPAMGDPAPLGSGKIIEAHQIEIKNSKNVIQAITVKPLPTAPKYDYQTDKHGVMLKVTEYDDTAAAAAALAAAPFGTGVIELEIAAIDPVQSRIRIGGTASGETYPDVTVDKGWDDIVRGSIWETDVWTLKAADEPDLENSPLITIDGSDRIIVDYQIIPTQDPLYNITRLTTIAVDRLNRAFVEYLEKGEQAPGIFEILIEGVAFPSTVSMNRPGVVYNYQVPRSGKYIHKVVHLLLRNGLDDYTLPPIWNGVESPAAATSIFPIRANTVHPAFSVSDENGIREEFAASSPAFYRIGDVLLTGAPCQLWRGTVFRLSLWYFSERGFSNTAEDGPVFIQTAHLPKSEDGGFKDPDDVTRLTFDGEYGDTAVVWGSSNGSQTSEEMAVFNYGPVRGNTQWGKIYSIRITSGGSVDPIVRATGSKAEMRFTFTDNPSIGETWEYEIVGAQYSPIAYGYEFIDASGDFSEGNRVAIGVDVGETRDNLVAALTGGDGAGVIYHTDVPVPFFEDVEAHASIPVRLTMTDRVAMVHTIDYVGTAQGTSAVIEAATNGAKVAEGASGEQQYRYNGADLFNVDREQIIPPNLNQGLTRLITYLSEKDITIRYVMHPEVTVEYQVDQAGAWTTLPVVTGEDLGSEDVSNVTEIQFRITNSSDTARMLRLYTEYTNG